VLKLISTSNLKFFYECVEERCSASLPCLIRRPLLRSVYIIGVEFLFGLGGLKNLFSDNDLIHPHPPPRRPKNFRSLYHFRGQKIFPDEYVAIALQVLHLNFSYKISVLSPKKQITTLTAISYAKRLQGLSPRFKISRGARAPNPPILYAYGVYIDISV
jgi:hypothetical protein